MRSFAQGFSDHINAEVTTLCWCWKLTRTDGFVMGFTNHDRDLVIKGLNYKAATGLTPGQFTQISGFETDREDITGVLSAEALKDEDLAAGLYNGATVELYRVNWRNTDQLASIWQGRFGDVVVRDGQFEVALKGAASSLERVSGRVFARSCETSFGTPECGLNPADFPEGTTCPRSIDACKGFANVTNFRGFPYLIGEDAAYAAPDENVPKDGRSRY